MDVYIIHIHTLDTLYVLTDIDIQINMQYNKIAVETLTILSFKERVKLKVLIF